VISRVATLLVLFAALLPAAPVVSSSISIRLAAAVVYCSDESRDEQEAPRIARPSRRRAVDDTRAPAVQFVAVDLAFALFQRPPPFVVV